MRYKLKYSTVDNKSIWYNNKVREFLVFSTTMYMDFSSLLQQSSLGFYKDFSSLLQQSSLGFYKSSHLGSDKDLVNAFLRRDACTVVSIAFQ